MDLTEQLGAVLPSDRLVTDPDILESYRHDRAALVPAGHPEALVRARCIEDVIATLRVASALSVPVVTRGAGTGLSGGANAVDGGIVLSTVGLDRIVDIDVPAQTATVECGVLNGDLAQAVAEQGLWYPPDPASRAISTIGGNIATNAGGSCCLKYGVTGDHVAGLRAVLADGTLIRTGRATRKNVAGLDLTSLLTGSEGILAVIVEATLRLRRAPRPPSTLVAFFGTFEEAAAAIGDMENAAELSLLELMDQTTIRAVEAMTHMGLDTAAEALLIAQSDTTASGHDVEACVAACTSAHASYVAHTDDPTEGELFLTARRSALPALERQGKTLLDDVAVPKPKMPAMLAAIRAIAARHEVVIGTFGHAGDGNLHPTIVFEPNDACSEAAASAAFDDIVRAALAFGGSITGEHGVGALKQPYLADMVGNRERELMSQIRAAFDPFQILNPGKAI